MEPIAIISNLKKQLLNGNTALFEEIYVMHSSYLKSVLLARKLCRITEVNDYINQTMIIFYDKIMENKADHIISIKNYLAGIVVNQAKLKKTYQTKVSEKESELKILFYDNNDTSLEEAEFKNELIQISKEAMSELTERCKNIIEAYYIRSMSMKEIATALNLSSGDVSKTLKNRCYNKLLKIVKKIMNR